MIGPQRPGGSRRPGRPRKQPGGRTALTELAGERGSPAEDPRPLIVDDGDVAATELDAPLAVAIAEIADREERSKQLSQLLRDLSATGAERVAAARVLESMDRASAGAEGDEAGPPPPSTRAEQVVRLVKVLACAGADVRIEALTIIANRAGEQRARILEMARLVSVPLTMPTQVAPPQAASGAPAAAPTMLPLPALAPLEEFHERTRING